MVRMPMPAAFKRVAKVLRPVYRHAQRFPADNLGVLSKAAFDHAWIATIEDSVRQDWYEPLSWRRMARQ
jgi:hypothetical protein